MTSRIQAFVLSAAAAALASPSSDAQCPGGTPGYTLDVPGAVEIGETFDLCLTAPPNSAAFLIISIDDAPPTPTPYGTLCVGKPLILLTLAIPQSGVACLSVPVDCRDVFIGASADVQFVGIGPAGSGVSNTETVTAVDGPCNQPCSGSIGDFVFIDADGDNVQDAGEVGIPDVLVTLADGSGTVIDADVTDASGFYQFTGLCAGTYTVTVDEDTVPGDLAPVLCDTGTNDAIDSDCSPQEVVLETDFSEDPNTDFGYAQCGECDGKVTSLQLLYTGDAPLDVQVEPDKGDLVFDGVIEPGDVVTLVHDPDEETFGNKLEFFVGGDEILEIHTSCSDPIGPGLEFGAFTVLAGASLDGGLLCPLGNLICAVGKPQTLTFEYTGEDCSASDNDQDEGKAVCSGDPMFEAPVRVVGFGDGIYFDGIVDAVGDTFTLDATAAGLEKFKSETFVDIYDLDGHLLQSIEFHTSCSQPLLKGDQYGSLVLTDFTLDI